MQKKTNLPIAGIILLVAACLISCDNDLAAPDETATVEATIDLQVGFGGTTVAVRINSEERFSAVLSDMVPLSGPQARFTTGLRRSANQLEVQWHSVGAPGMQIESRIVTPGDRKQLHLGLGIIADTLSVTVQENPFGYL